MNCHFFELGFDKYRFVLKGFTDALTAKSSSV